MNVVCRGDLPDKTKTQTLTQTYAMTIMWLFPKGAQGPRDNPHVKTLCCYCSFLLGLIELVHKPHHSHRMILRALPPRVQRFFYYGAADPQTEAALMAYLTICTGTIWNLFPDTHCTYCEWSLGLFYWGTTKNVRSTTQHVLSGAAQRHVEHLWGVMVREYREGHRLRYVRWRAHPAHHLRVAYALIGSGEESRAYETYLIRYGQANVQGTNPGNVDAANVVTRTTLRPFPRFRDYPSVGRELSLNHYVRWRKEFNVGITERTKAQDTQAPLRLCIWFQTMVYAGLIEPIVDTPPHSSGPCRVDNNLPTGANPIRPFHLSLKNPGFV